MGKSGLKKYSADFETSTWEKDKTWVWGWALCDIDNTNNVEVGNNIDTFFNRIKEENMIIYFHNLKFDRFFYIKLSIK